MSRKSTDPIVGVHLDFKGMMFKPSYIPHLLKDLASQKVNTVLVEYEDIFPFEGIEIARDKSAVWTKATLRRFLKTAKDNGIEVIPLVQCLGHLEYVLAWPKYKKFSADTYPSTIDVANPKAVALIKDMLQQVIDAHPDSRIIHLGMDEAHGLHVTAKRMKRPVLDVFMQHLETLLPIVEAAGKQPYIWTDMVQDHFSPQFIKTLRDRNVLMGIWDYTQTPGDWLPTARFDGQRVSKQWLKDLKNPEAPLIQPNTQFAEDCAPAIRKLIKPHQKGRLFRRHLQLDIFTKLGMPCVPVSALRASSNGEVLPPYHGMTTNIQGWGKAVKRCRAQGQIASSWARGTTWCPPNYCIDLSWPLIAELAKCMGKKPARFWPDIPAKTVDRIVHALGRCRDGLNAEDEIAAEIESLAPKVKIHKHEWIALGLMARVLQLHKRTDFNILEVDYFYANDRPTPEEWQRRINEQTQTLADIAKLRERVRKHFEKRYRGEAFEEWLRHLFDLRVDRLRACRQTCRDRKQRSRVTYSRK